MPGVGTGKPENDRPDRPTVREPTCRRSGPPGGFGRSGRWSGGCHREDRRRATVRRVCPSPIPGAGEVAGQTVRAGRPELEIKGTGCRVCVLTADRDGYPATWG